MGQMLLYHLEKCKAACLKNNKTKLADLVTFSCKSCSPGPVSWRSCKLYLSFLFDSEMTVHQLSVEVTLLLSQELQALSQGFLPQSGSIDEQHSQQRRPQKMKVLNWLFLMKNRIVPLFHCVLQLANKQCSHYCEIWYNKKC